MIRLEIITKIVVEKDVGSVPTFLGEILPTIENLKWDTPIEIHSRDIISVRRLEAE